MGTDLVVAPSEAAKAVAMTPVSERPWPQHRGEWLYLCVEALMLFHAHLDGADPDAPMEPRVAHRNPLTGREFVLPKAFEYRRRFEPIPDGSDDSGSATYRCPDRFTEQVANLDDAGLRDIAMKWLVSSNKIADAQEASPRLTQAATESNLDALRKMARQAAARGQALFLCVRDFDD